jgi:branched-chain amino acid transport system substrate-binding protein
MRKRVKGGKRLDNSMTRRGFLKHSAGALGTVGLFSSAGTAFLFPKKAFAQGDVIRIGQTCALTGPHTHTGLAVSRGAEIAVDFINAKGGVLGKKLQMVVLDDAGLPPNGVANTRRLATREKCVAILGGYHSTVGLAMRAPIHELGIPYISPYCANTEIIENGHKPNFMFRVSAKDKWVAQFLVDFAVNGLSKRKLGVICENTGWGEGGRKDLLSAIDKIAMKPVGIEQFNWGDKDMTPQLIRLREKGADCLVGYYLDPEGAQMVKSMDKINYKPQILSAWGISGNFAELTGNELAEGTMVSMTYAWCGKLDSEGQKIYDYLIKKYGTKADCREFRTGSGIANAYDAVHILALAIEKAGTASTPECWSKIREALEKKVDHYEGLITTYKPPFLEDQERHDAILPENYLMTVWHNGYLVPITQTPHWKKVVPDYQKKYLQTHPRAKEIMERK